MLEPRLPGPPAPGKNTKSKNCTLLEVQCQSKATLPKLQFIWIAKVNISNAFTYLFQHIKVSIYNAKVSIALSKNCNAKIIIANLIAPNRID